MVLPARPLDRSTDKMAASTDAELEAVIRLVLAAADSVHGRAVCSELKVVRPPDVRLLVVRVGARISLAGALLAIALLLAVGVDRGPAAIPPRPPTSPVGVIQRYLAALAAHNAAGICATFSLQLQAYIQGWDSGPDCRSRVSRSHWSSYSPGKRVTDIRIVRVRKIMLDRYGNLAIHLVLWFDYACIGDVGPIPGCKPGFQNRTNLIYLRHMHRRWLIDKPGQVYDDTDSTATPAGYDPTTPPGDSSTITRRARLHEPVPPCPAAGIGADGRSRSLVSSDGRKRVPFSTAPWVHIQRVTAVRTGRQFCITLTLGAAPRVDTLYLFNIDQADAGGDLAEQFSLQIDATGRVRAQLTDPSSPRSRPASTCRTGYGMNRDTLEMIVTARFLRPDRPVLTSASSESLQTGEPLLRHPLDAGDTAPRVDGLRLPPSDPRLGSCAIA
jgi:hypothetical protein